MNIQEDQRNGLYFRTWHVDNPKGVVQLIHGLAEHCQRYNHLASALNQAGYAVYSMDLPGHGQSSGIRGHVESFAVFENAALSLYDSLNIEYPDLPKFILGHSMGGLIVSQLLLNHQDKFSGALLSGPAIQSPQEPPAWQVFMIKQLAKALPKAGMLGLDASGISRDKAVVEAYMNDPLIWHNKLSAQFLVSFNTAMETVLEQANTIDLPILLMHGSSDEITSPEGSAKLFDSCNSDDKELKMYEGLAHEIFNEPEHPQIFSELIEWLDHRA